MLSTSKLIYAGSGKHRSSLVSEAEFACLVVCVHAVITLLRERWINPSSTQSSISVWTLMASRAVDRRACALTS